MLSHAAHILLEQFGLVAIDDGRLVANIQKGKCLIISYDAVMNMWYYAWEYRCYLPVGSRLNATSIGNVTDCFMVGKRGFCGFLS